jgi:signal peptidase
LESYVRLHPNRWDIADLHKPFKNAMKFAVPVFSDSHAIRCELATEVLRSYGTLKLQVTGSSMLPSVFPGDILIVERAQAASTREGDIVLVGREGRLFAHRLMGKQGGRPSNILTRGDSMATADAPVDEEQLLGRVSFIVRNGKCIEPRRTLRISERAVAALVQRSDVAARVVVSVHGLRQDASNQVS